MSVPFLALVAGALAALAHSGTAFAGDDAPPRVAATVVLPSDEAGPGPILSEGAGVARAITPREGNSRLSEAPIAVNRVSAEDLERLPGIGPRKATAMVEARNLRPFKRPSDLRRVKGLGPKTIQRLAPLLSFE